MKKEINVESLLKQNGIIDAMIESVARFMKVNKETASKIVEMKLNKTLNTIGKNITDYQYQSQKANSDSPIADMSNEDIINNENTIKDK